MSDDFRNLAAKLLQDAPSLLASWYPAGKLYGREFRLGDVTGAPGKSLGVNLDTGVWKDFSGGKGGADLISLYAAMHDINQGEAFTALGGQYSEKSATKIKKEALVYIAGYKCEKPPKNKRLGLAPVAVYDYFSVDVEKDTYKRIGHICRFEPYGMRKEFLPLTQWRNPDGTAFWSWKKWPMISPLYHLFELLANKDKPVIVVEGEGKCDRAQRLTTAYQIVAWPGGAKGVAHVDWAPLKNRDVWIWPDNDNDGRSAAQNIKAILPDAKIVRIPEGLPEKWDLGDAPDDFDIAAHLLEDMYLPAKAAPPPTIKKRDDFAKQLTAINSEYAVIIHGSKVLIMRHWKGEDGQSDLRFFSERDFLLYNAPKIVYLEDDEGKTKQVSVAKEWLKWQDRQQYEAVYFEPCGKEYNSRYNLWRGFPVSPKEGDCSLFITHIHDNICKGDERHFKWVMAWLADLFQRPARKLGTSLVLRGPMGIGKGVFANHIGRLLGKHYMAISQRSQLIGKFNSHMADKLLMFVDEGWWSDDSNYGIGVLRALITEQEMTIEMKGKDAVTMANYTRFIIAANADWVVPVSHSDERRFSILDVSDNEQGNREYFKAIQQQMKDGGYEALLHLLLNYRYDESLPGKIIKTEALAENKIYSMPNEIKWWYECLMQEKIGDFNLTDSYSNTIKRKVFYDAYLKWMNDIHFQPTTDYVLARTLSPVIVNMNSTRLAEIDGSRPRSYVLQDLSTMRRYFEQYIGNEMKWEQDF